MLRKIDETKWELPVSEGMRVPGVIFGSEKIVSAMEEGVFKQLSNVAALPGIVKNALCMPDGHWGYGFPIGGVAATNPEEQGVISPGGIGFDINCGMRLMTVPLKLKEVQPKVKEIVRMLFDAVPTGVGCKSNLRFTKQQFKEIMGQGSRWVVEQGYGVRKDVSTTEEKGMIPSDFEKVSEKAVKRGFNQVGTLGSGNHFLEIQQVDEIFDENTAKVFGIEQDYVTVMIHCGSRGMGHQVASDYLKRFSESKDAVKMPDKELASVPFHSELGQDYYNAMGCAANMAFANRQMIMHKVREVFKKLFGEMEMKLMYDVCHNIAKMERHKVNGRRMDVLVHRKGATRSFGPQRKEIPSCYQETGQPVIVGGSMETGSYILCGTEKAEEESFGSTCHGAGRIMSRAAAKKIISGDEIQRRMARKGIFVMSKSMSGLAEEAGAAYKNISEVIESVHKAGLSKKVACVKPIGNIKG